MQNDSYTENVDIHFVNWLLLVVKNDLWSHKTRSSALGKYDSLLVLKSGQSIIDNFKPLSSVTLFKSIFVFKQYIFRLYVSVHDVSVDKVFDSLKNLFDDSSDLMWLKLFLFFPVLNLLVKCNAFEQFKHKVVLVAVFKDFEQSHKVFMLELTQDFQFIENRFLSIFYGF